MSTIIEHRSCNCEDRPACGCDNGAFEVEVEEMESEDSQEWDGQPDEMQEWEDFERPQEDRYLDSSWEDRFECDCGD